MFSTCRMKQKPMFMIIPMIDIIFFLLVFFMMSGCICTACTYSFAKGGISFYRREASIYGRGGTIYAAYYKRKW